MQTPRIHRVLGFLILFLATVQMSCLLIPNDKESGHLVSNLRPSVRITGGAMVPDSTGVSYKVTFQWSGTDDDGVVVLYQWAADDTVSEKAWRDTTGFSAQFLFKATTPVKGNANVFSDWHTFYIRAIDNEFSVSASDKRYFNATTIAPTSQLVFPDPKKANGQTLQQTLKFEWQGDDLDSSKPDRKPLYFEYKLVHANGANEDPVIQVDSLMNGINLLHGSTSVGTPRDWIRVPNTVTNVILQEIPAGASYVFGLRAVDEAGATEPSLESKRNMINFSVGEDPSRPSVLVKEASSGSHNFPDQGDTWTIDVPANRPLRFTWVGDASAYGSQAGNSNYALDIPDPEDQTNLKPDGIGGWAGWGSWSANSVPFIFPLEQAGTTHDLYIYMRDISDAESSTRKCQIVMHVVAFTHDRFALMVDDWLPYISVGKFQQNVIDTGPVSHGFPSEHAFLRSTLLRSIFDLGFGSVDTLQLRVQTGASPSLIPLSVIAHYQNIFWIFGATSANNGLVVNEGYVGGGNNAPAPQKRLTSFLTSGGRLFLFGGSLAGGVLGGINVFPIPPPTSGDLTEEGNFDFQFMCYRNNIVGYNMFPQVCPNNEGIVVAHAMNPAYPDLYLDRTKRNPYWTGIPSDPHSPPEFYGGIPNWEGSKLGLNQTPTHVAGLDSLYWSETWSHSNIPRSGCDGSVGAASGGICAMRSSSTKADTLAGTQHGRFIFFDFEPYFFQADQVTDAGTAAINWLLSGHD